VAASTFSLLFSLSEPKLKVCNKQKTLKYIQRTPQGTLRAFKEKPVKG
jgi:hypothetical protein